MKIRAIKCIILLIFLISGGVSSIFLSNFNYNREINDKSERDKDDSVPTTSLDHPPDADDFKFYKEITINHNNVSGTGNLIDFPLLISIFDEDLHDEVQSDGDDIAFANDFQMLDHEIELFNQTYNDTHAQLIAWVRIPVLSPFEDTVIRMYYGNPLIRAQENPEGVWDSNYKSVWHLSEDPIGTFYDSTSNSNDGTGYNLQSDDQVDGQIDGSIDFDNVQDYIVCGNDNSLNVGSNDFSLSLWFKYDGMNMGVLA
jgi:hypothetical protein